MLILSFSKIPKKNILDIKPNNYVWGQLSYLISKHTCTLCTMNKETFYGLQFLFTKASYGRIYFLNLNSILFLCKILLNILYWNSLNLLSNVVLKGSEYIFSQSSWMREWWKLRYISFALLIYWRFWNWLFSLQYVNWNQFGLEHEFWKR